MDFSPQQARALVEVDRWFNDPSGSKVFKLFGYAGTGKTTLAKHFAEHVKRPVFAAYTGKAASVMRQKGCPNAMTIHRLIYRPAGEEGPDFSPTFEVCPYSAAASAGLIIIDECSMIDEKLALDLLSFGVKILVLGDPAQLPPITDDGTVIEGYFNRGDPDVLLTEIHRQAADSPVLHLATLAREGKPLPIGSYGDSRVVIDDDQHLEPHDQLLVWTNQSRRNYNGKIRLARGFRSHLPEVGEKLICTQNNAGFGILNGEQFTVTAGGQPNVRNTIKLSLASLDEEGYEHPGITAWVHPFMGCLIPSMRYRAKQRHAELDRSYAITVHKAQGSEWPHVMVYNEYTRKDRDRWLYTAITRAQQRVTIIQP